MSVISLNTWSYINQNTDLEVTNLPTFEYDYELIFNNVTINDIFAYRNYIQNGSDANKIDINLAINESQLYTHVDATLTEIVAGGNVSNPAITTGCETGKKKFGLRLLEILAIKIFGHARARAAIANDSAFYLQSLYNTLSNSMNSALTTDRNLIFCQYVNLDRIENSANGVDAYNDVNGAMDFNFKAINMVFPVRLVGSLLDSNASSALKNGPNVGGFSNLLDGNYNVPLKVVFLSD